MWFGVGGNAFCALLLGEGRHADAERSLGNTITVSIFAWIGVLLIANSGGLLDTILIWSSATEETLPMARTFVIILSWGFIFQTISGGISNFVRTAGSPNVALLTMVVGAVFCTIFNYLFVIQWGWGIQGSAYATVLGQLLSCLPIFWFFFIQKHVPLKIRAKYLRPHGDTVKNILVLGLASFAIQAGTVVIAFVTNAQLAIYGALSPIGVVNALASIGVVQRVAMFLCMPLIGMSIALQPILGYNYGARKFQRVKSTLFIGTWVAVVLGAIMWVLVMLWPQVFVALFGIEEGPMMEFTSFALRIQCSLLVPVAFQIVGSNYFQAVGKAVQCTLLSLSRQVLFLVPLLIILPIILPPIIPSLTGLDCLYVATPVADFLSIVATAILLVIEMRKLNASIRQQEGETPEA